MAQFYEKYFKLYTMEKYFLLTIKKAPQMQGFL